MSTIVFADDGIPFDGLSLREGPLGGAETAAISLLEALAARGHRVIACTKGRPMTHNGVIWQEIAAGIPDSADLYIANRGHRLIGRCPRARRRAFWLHNPAGYVLKPRYLLRFIRWRPVLVFLGPHHAATLPAWVPGRRRIIPYGLAETFRTADPGDEAPRPPRAVFTSNPLRGLDWLMDLWQRDIRPQVPGAELHLYCGAGVYRGGADHHGGQIRAVLDAADRAAPAGIRRHDPVGKAELVDIFRGSRVMLYRGDVGETFCLALAEAQALGVPCVVRPIGSVAERVIDGVTGHVADSDAAFAAHAVRLLRDDGLWLAQRRAALATQRARGWDAAAADWETLLA